MKFTSLKGLLCLTLAASLAGCGSSNGGTASTPSETTTAVSETTGSETAASEGSNITADSFLPTQDFNIRVPFAAGGTLDTIVRIFAQGLQETYGKTVIVNNLTGANGTISGADLASADSDATQLMAGGIAMFTLAPLFNPDASLKIDDYQFVSGLVQEDFVLFANPDQTGINNWNDLVSYAKNNRVVFGSNAPGGTTHLLATMLFNEAGIDAEAVTSDGSAKDLLATVGGNVTCAIATTSLGEQYVEEGSLVPIMVFSDEDYTGYDGYTVKTAKSFGYDIVFRSCNFLMTKSDVNHEDVEAVHQALVDYSKTDEFKELAKNAAYTPSLDDGDTVKKIIEDAAEMCQEAYEKYYKN